MSKALYYLECIKSFSCDGGSVPILEGEQFKVIDSYDLIEGLPSRSVNPGMEICLDNSQLLNFKFLRNDPRKNT